MKRIFLLIYILFISLLTLSCGGGKKKGDQPHILLITIDTLRYDHLGCYGYPRQTSPFIDKLASEGLRFKHVVAPEPLTGPNHATIITSLHPLTHNLMNNGEMLDSRIQTIAEKLKQHDYYTIGAVAVKIINEKQNFAQGFDRFSGTWDKSSPNNTAHYRCADSINQSLYDMIDAYKKKQTGKPLFIWVHYFDPHFPYTGWKDISFKDPLPPITDKRLKAAEIENYDREIRYTDNHIKALYRHLSAKGLAKDLVTCITADHGEEFGEHGGYYRHADFYSETALVPLVFHGPGIPGKETADQFVSSMDVATTLLGRAGLTFDYPVDGIDLVKMIEKKGKDAPGNRKFLVIGNPVFTRSLQMIGAPYSYIENFDFHYKHWFISFDNELPDSRFQPVNPKWIKKEKNFTQIKVPNAMNRGKNYMVLRFNLKENNGMAIRVHVLPQLLTDWVNVAEKVHDRQIDVIYPVSVLDELRFRLKLEKGTNVENLRYSILEKKDFPQKSAFLRTQKNQIYNKISSKRKRRKEDEFFNLSHDMGMRDNLIAKREHKPVILKLRKMMYTLFKYYSLNGKKLLKGGKAIKKLTKKDKDMLKSLGYL